MLVIDSLGYYEPCQHICDWMGWLPDDTPLVQVNIPGTHDTSTVSRCDCPGR